jgi:hypothetical protein
MIIKGNELKTSNGVVDAILTCRGFSVTADTLVKEALSNLDTFYLSPHAHIRWRKGRGYDEYPYRYVTTLNLINRV